VIHVKSYTEEMGIGSLLNADADHYATKAQSAIHHILSALIPTFFMEDYAFFCEGDGWIETNIRVFIDYFLAKQSASTLAHTYHYCMATWLYDPRSQPIYLYTKASSAYLAMVQLYTRLGQLPTASNMKQKKQTGDSACRYGCKATEVMYHVFIKCGRFEALRGEVRGLIVRRVEKRVEEFKLEESHVMGLLKAAKSFDSSVILPLHYSVYYLGPVLNLDPLVSRQAFSSTMTHV
jgi:hypothetical protein